MGARALREIYLRGFEIVVRDAKPWTVMTSYNKVNGTYTSESPELLRGVLRDEWGFAGLVMTDWFGGKDAVAQMKAGNELLMPGTARQQQVLLEALASGALPEAVLDRNVAVILELIQRTPAFHGYEHKDAPDLKANALAARAAAADGMVLLKNAGVLPLAAGTKLALLGNTSYSMITGGTGSGDVNEAYSDLAAPGPEGRGAHCRRRARRELRALHQGAGGQTAGTDAAVRAAHADRRDGGDGRRDRPAWRGTRTSRC